METTPIRNLGFLRAHKALPRRRLDVDDERSKTRQMRHAVNGHKECLRDDFAKIRSWIPEPPQMPADEAKRLPLTPPALTVEEEANIPLKQPIPEVHPIQSSGPSTPIHQRSPPTPDITPPRARLRIPSSPPHGRVPSSDAQSFQTAVEYLPSDDEALRLDVPTHNLAYGSNKILVPGKLRSSRPRRVGLGLQLGDSLDDEEKTEDSNEGGLRIPAKRSNNTFQSSTDALNDHSSNATVLGPFPQYLQAAAASPHDSHLPLHEAEVLEDPIPVQYHLNTASRRDRDTATPPDFSTMSLDKQHAPFGDVVVSEPHSEPRPEHKHRRESTSKRVSGMSTTTSTIVEALVVDTTPPQAARTLRRTSKTLSLRAASSQANDSNRSSLNSETPLQRLTHRNARISERVPRRSIMSDVIPSTTLAHDDRIHIPSAVVPQRRSSLKSSRIRRQLHILAHGQKEQSERPSTVPEPNSQNPDLAIEKPHTRSAALAASRASKPRTRRTSDSRPPYTIPTRSSSLSAPTSRNVSRRTSLTSSSLHVHNQATANQTAQTPIVAITQPNTPPEPSSPLPHESPPEDPSSLRLNPPLRTPFSLASFNSSTPGTLEVNEATAINIYPHNNHSILVVQSISRQNSNNPEPQLTHTATLAPSARINPKPVTHIPNYNRLVTSPLTRPRAAPEPPALTVQAPTPIPPSRLSSRPEQQRQSAGPLTRLRRSLSARRYSAPIAQALSRRSSTTTSRHSSAPTRSRARDSLSPFWRPRGFWNDLSDSDSESDFGDAGPSPPPPSRRRGSSSLPGAHHPSPSALSRTLGSLHRRGRANSLDPRGAATRRPRIDETVKVVVFPSDEPVSSVRRERVRGVSEVRFAGFGALQERFEGRRRRREEERRERERRAIRESIGMVISQPDARLA